MKFTREILSDLLFILGIILVSVGAFLIYVPVGFIVSGLGAVIVAWLLVKPGDDNTNK